MGINRIAEFVWERGISTDDISVVVGRLKLQLCELFLNAGRARIDAFCEQVYVGLNRAEIEEVVFVKNIGKRGQYRDDMLAGLFDALVSAATLPCGISILLHLCRGRPGFSVLEHCFETRFFFQET